MKKLTDKQKLERKIFNSYNWEFDLEESKKAGHIILKCLGRKPGYGWFGEKLKKGQDKNGYYG
jgi:hypothetical protein